MKQLFFLILFISSNILANPITLSKKEFENLNNLKNSKAVKKRLVQYIRLKKKIKDYELIRKLSHVNSFYNRILPIDDKNKYNADDYWATPKEFLIEGRGDCEDYAIAKYFTLKEVGIDASKLFLGVVQVKGESSYHMVLFYFKDFNSIPLVLDNLSFKVISLSKRPKLIPKFIFNEKKIFTLKNKRIYKRVGKINWGKVDKWEDLLNRVYALKQ